MATVAETGRRVESRNPARREDLVAEVELADAAGFAAACRTAHAAQRGWERVPAPVRGGVIKNAGRLVESNKQALARLVSLRDSGAISAEEFATLQARLR